MKYITKEQAELREGKGYSKLVFAENVDMESSKSLVQMIIMGPNTRVESHYHEKTTEIFYFLSGSGRFVIDGTTFEPETGSVLICEPNEKHYTINESDTAWKYMAFKTYQGAGDTTWD